MEKINRQRAPKGTVTIRKKGNSYEARVTLALNSIMEGVDKNPRLSRTARSEKEARKRLGELITNVYFDIKRNVIKKREKMNNLQYGQEWDNNEYVFLNTIGTPYVPERLTKKITEFIKKHKLEHMTIYGFRHSFATLMSEKGMDKEVLRELMGHAEFETTDFYYIHVSEERKKKEFERVNFEQFQGKTKNVES